MKLAIVRPKAEVQSLDSYNSQEVGLARGLAKLGIETDIFVAGNEARPVFTKVDSDGPGKIQYVQVPHWRVPELGFALFRGFSKLLRDGKYSVVQVNESHELVTWRVSAMCAKHGIPVILYQGMYQHIPGRTYSAYQWIHDRFCLPAIRKSIDFAMAKTTRAKEFLRCKGFNDVRILPVGLDVAPFQTNTPSTNDEIEKIDRSRPIILYVGVMEPRRNPHFILDVAASFDPERANFVLAGVGPQYDEIVKRVADTPLPNVKVLGKVLQKDLPALYDASTIFLLPTDYEIYGMVVLESMYFGVPVLSTRTAGPEDMIVDGRDGVLFDSLDKEQWKTRIEGLLADPSLLDAMSERAVEKVREGLSWDQIAIGYANQLEILLQSRAIDV